MELPAMFHGKQSEHKSRSDLGRLGEDMACRYLKKSRFKILERNFRQKWGELDIIALAPDDTLVFFEVKTVLGGKPMIAPEEQMTKAKITKTKRIAQFYANQRDKISKKGWRVDVLSLKIIGDKCRLKHYENI